jgi:hypothetical protein
VQHDLSTLNDAAIAALIERVWAAPSPQPYTIMFHLSGAIPSSLSRGRCIRRPQRRVRSKHQRGVVES